MENKRSSREKHTFRPSALKNKKTRMRARDFGTPLVIAPDPASLDPFNLPTIAMAGDLVRVTSRH